MFRTLSLVLLLGTGGASGEQLFLSPPTDATEFGSTRLEPAFFVLVPEGEWRFSVISTYFNQWDGSWHTRRIRTVNDRVREPLRPDEVESIEAAFPDDGAYHLDVEGWRVDMVAATGLPAGWVLSLQVPWISIGSHSMDSVSESVHDVIPEGKALGRDLFARGSTAFYMQTDRGVLFRGEDLEGSGVGDVTIGLTRRLESRPGHRFGIAIDLPTGERGTLRGSGGVDVTVGWVGRWERPKRRWTAGAGVSWLDPSGDLLGLERSHVAHLNLDVTQRVWRSFHGRVAVRLDSSPLGGVTDSSMQDPAIYYHLGGFVEAGDVVWIVEIGEQIIPQIGIDADWSLHLGWSLKK